MDGIEEIAKTQCTVAEQVMEEQRRMGTWEEWRRALWAKRSLHPPLLSSFTSFISITNTGLCKFLNAWFACSTPKGDMQTSTFHTIWGPYAMEVHSFKKINNSDCWHEHNPDSLFAKRSEPTNVQNWHNVKLLLSYVLIQFPKYPTI